MSGSLIPNITFAAQNNPLYASQAQVNELSTIVAGGGSGPLDTLVVSTLAVSSIVTVGTGQLGQYVKSQAFFTSTFVLNPAPNTSTLLLTTNNSGLYCWSGAGNKATVNPINNASIDNVANILLGGNDYATYLNLVTTNAVPVVTGFTASGPTPGSPGPIEFYYINNSGDTPVVAASFTQLG